MSIDADVMNGFATITINRPERMDAMDAEHSKGLLAWIRARDDETIRVGRAAFAEKRPPNFKGR